MKLTKEIRIALVAIVGILVMYFGINFLKGINLFSTNNTYYMTFDDIQGMGASTPIYADGYKVGTVDQLDFDYSGKGPIKVKVDINKDLRIPAGSTAEISKDIMGNLQVSLLLANNPRERIEPGGIIPGMVNSGMMGKAAEMIPVVTVSSRPRGLPIAMTSSPTTRDEESAKLITCRSDGGSTSWSTARSVVGSVPTMVASSVSAM